MLINSPNSTINLNTNLLHKFNNSKNMQNSFDQVNEVQIVELEKIANTIAQQNTDQTEHSSLNFKDRIETCLLSVAANMLSSNIAVSNSVDSESCSSSASSSHIPNELTTHFLFNNQFDEFIKNIFLLNQQQKQLVLSILSNIFFQINLNSVDFQSTSSSSSSSNNLNESALKLILNNYFNMFSNDIYHLNKQKQHLILSFLSCIFCRINLNSNSVNSDLPTSSKPATDTLKETELIFLLNNNFNLVPQLLNQQQQQQVLSIVSFILYNYNFVLNFLYKVFVTII